MKKFIILLAIAFFMPNDAVSAAVEASATDDTMSSRACYARKIEEAREELDEIRTAVRSMGLINRVNLFNFSGKIPGIPMPSLTYRFSGYISDVYVDMKPGIVLIGPKRYGFDPLTGLMTKSIGHTETIFKGFYVFSFLENKIDYIRKERSRAAKYATIIEINGVQFAFSPGVLTVNNTFYSIKDGFVYAKNDPRKRKVKVYTPPLSLEPFLGHKARIYGAEDHKIPDIKVWYTNNPRQEYSGDSPFIKDSETARAMGLMLYESKAVPSLSYTRLTAVRDVIIRGSKIGEICYSEGNCPVAVNSVGVLLTAEALRRAGIDPSGILTD